MFNVTAKTKIAYAVTFAGIMFTAIAWRSTVWHLFDLVQSVDVFAHGQLVPFITLALIWSRRTVLAQLEPRFSLWGIAVFLVAICIWLFGEIVDSAFFAHVGFITAIQGVVLFAFGRQIYQTILFPMAFLFLMIPFGYALVVPLQYLTADMVINILHLVGADVRAEGVLIELPSGLYEVAQACAGIRFLFTSIVTSVLLANLVFKSWGRRVMILCVGIILPIVANIVRVLTILGIAEMTDQSFAKDVDHLIYGWVFLSIVLLALIAFAYRVSDMDDSSHITIPPLIKQTTPTVYAAWACILLLLPFFATSIFPSQFGSAYEEGIVEKESLFTAPPEGYRLLPENPFVPQPLYANADRIRTSTLRSGGVVFSVYKAEYKPLGPGKRLFQNSGNLIGADWDELTGLQNKNHHVCGQKLTEYIFSKRQDRMLIWNLVRINGMVITNSLEEKLITLKFRILGQEPIGEVIVMTANVAGEVEMARAAFNAFLSAFFDDGDIWVARRLNNEGENLCAA